MANKVRSCNRCGDERPPGRRHLCDYCRDHCPRCGDLRDPGRNTYCKPCATDWARENRRKNPEKYNKTAREYRAKNPDKWRASRRAWNKNNPDKIREMHLRKYNMTVEDYDTLLYRQGNKCATCPATEPGRGRKHFFVDHDHDHCPQKVGCCGQCVRGLLCNTCNRVLGLLREDTLVLFRLGQYLRNWRRYGQTGDPGPPWDEAEEEEVA